MPPAAEHFRHVKYVRNLLMAHRVPPALFEWLLQQTQRLWQGLTTLDVLSECTPHPPCHPRQCTHGVHTRACSLVVEMPLAPGGPNVMCEANPQTQQCVCEAVHPTETVRHGATCPWDAHVVGADVSMRAFRSFEWPADCPTV